MNNCTSPDLFVFTTIWTVFTGGGLVAWIGYKLTQGVLARMYERWFTVLGRTRAEAARLREQLDRIEERERNAAELKALREDIATRTKRLADTAFTKPEHFND